MSFSVDMEAAVLVAAAGAEAILVSQHVAPKTTANPGVCVFFWSNSETEFEKIYAEIKFIWET